MEKETLEAAAENYANDCTLVSEAASYVAFIDGAKWQAERMYSEEDVIKIVEKSRETGLTAEYLLLTYKQQEQ
jgi:hypothetical protein